MLERMYLTTTLTMILMTVIRMSLLYRWLTTLFITLKFHEKFTQLVSHLEVTQLIYNVASNCMCSNSADNYQLPLILWVVFLNVT